MILRLLASTILILSFHKNLIIHGQILNKPWSYAKTIKPYINSIKPPFIPLNPSSKPTVQPFHESSNRPLINPPDNIIGQEYSSDLEKKEMTTQFSIETTTSLKINKQNETSMISNEVIDYQEDIAKETLPNFGVGQSLSKPWVYNQESIKPIVRPIALARSNSRNIYCLTQRRSKGGSKSLGLTCGPRIPKYPSRTRLRILKVPKLHQRQKKIGYFPNPNTNGWYYSPGYSYNLAKPNVIPIARNHLSNEFGRIANQKPVKHKIRPSHYKAKTISEVFEYTPTFQEPKFNDPSTSHSYSQINTPYFGYYVKTLHGTPHKFGSAWATKAYSAHL